MPWRIGGALHSASTGSANRNRYRNTEHANSKSRIFHNKSPRFFASRCSPSSSRLANRYTPGPFQNTSFTRSPLDEHRRPTPRGRAAQQRPLLARLSKPTGVQMDNTRAKFLNYARKGSLRKKLLYTWNIRVMFS